MKKIIIIGAGISGLSCGVYARQHGFETILLEKNANVGGCCTGWYRKNHYLDGCIHWLTGTKEDGGIYRMWKNVGAFDSQDDLIFLNAFKNFNYQGVNVPLYTDVDKTEEEWLKISPEDEKQTRKFFRIVRAFVDVTLFVDRPTNYMSFKQLLAIALQVIRHPSYLFAMLESPTHASKKFKNPALRFAVKNSQTGDCNLFTMFYSYATVIKGDGALPKGGSRAFAERIKNRYLSLGGNLKVNADVDHIIVDNNTAIGVVLANGERIYGDYVIAACDPKFALDKLLRGQYHYRPIERRHKNYSKYALTSCTMSFYAVKNAGEIPIPYVCGTNPVKVGTQYFTDMDLRSFAYEPDLYVKDGKTVVLVRFDQYAEDYDYWKYLYDNDPKQYIEEKEELAKNIETLMVKEFPNWEGKIEHLDTCTPVTYSRYVNATKGSYMAFMFSPRNTRYTLNGLVHKLHNFHLSGQWMQCPGGLPFAVMEGKYTIIRICHKEKIKFNYSL